MSARFAMTDPSVREGELLWTPDAATVEVAGVTRFLCWLAAERGLTVADYDALWRWSIDDLEGFLGGHLGLFRGAFDDAV